MAFSLRGLFGPRVETKHPSAASSSSTAGRASSSVPPVSSSSSGSRLSSSVNSVFDRAKFERCHAELNANRSLYEHLGQREKSAVDSRVSQLSRTEQVVLARLCPGATGLDETGIKLTDFEKIISDHHSLRPVNEENIRRLSPKEKCDLIAYLANSHDRRVPEGGLKLLPIIQANPTAPTQTRLNNFYQAAKEQELHRTLRAVVDSIPAGSELMYHDPSFDLGEVDKSITPEKLKDLTVEEKWDLFVQFAKAFEKEKVLKTALGELVKTQPRENLLQNTAVKEIIKINKKRMSASEKFAEFHRLSKPLKTLPRDLAIILNSTIELQSSQSVASSSSSQPKIILNSEIMSDFMRGEVDEVTTAERIKSLSVEEQWDLFVQSAKSAPITNVLEKVALAEILKIESRVGLTPAEKFKESAIACGYQGTNPPSLKMLPRHLEMTLELGLENKDPIVSSKPAPLTSGPELSLELFPLEEKSRSSSLVDIPQASRKTTYTSPHQPTPYDQRAVPTFHMLRAKYNLIMLAHAVDKERFSQFDDLEQVLYYMHDGKLSKNPTTYSLLSSLTPQQKWFVVHYALTFFVSKKGESQEGKEFRKSLLKQARLLDTQHGNNAEMKLAHLRNIIEQAIKSDKAVDGYLPRAFKSALVVTTVDNPTFTAIGDKDL